MARPKAQLIFGANEDELNSIIKEEIDKAIKAIDERIMQYLTSKIVALPFKED